MKSSFSLFFCFFLYQISFSQNHSGHDMSEEKTTRQQHQEEKSSHPHEKHSSGYSINKVFEPTGRVVTYHLYIHDTIVNYTGKKVKAIAINGKIPGPTLFFTEGDTAEIIVHNRMDMETSVHWHGILLPNIMDGVPYLTTPPIEPHSYFTYRFAVRQSGTYWYHSHTMLQEQSGLYGSIVIHPRAENYKVEDELVLLLSDWTNQKPGKVLKNLKRRNEYYTIRKGYAQSLNNLIRYNAVGERLSGSRKRMPPMDISDVYYNLFMVNGLPVLNLNQYRSGDKIRFRIINAGASTIFYLQFAGGQMQVIAADGPEVESVMTDEILIAPAETYDVIITVPEEGAAELRATAQDISGYSSVFIGNGPKISVPDMPKLNVWNMNEMMNMPGMEHSSMSGMEMGKEKMPEEHLHGKKEIKSSDSSIHHGGHSMNHGESDKKEMNMDTTAAFNYHMLRAIEKTSFEADKPVKEIVLKLTGNMYRYVWSMNNIVLSRADKIMIQKGEVVRIVLDNQTMMSHPMHLHGHFFRVLTKQGDYSPLKHTVNVTPFSKTIIEFYANEEKDWFFHCHILYHMMSGMSRIFSYQNSVRDTLLNTYPLKGLLREDRQWFFWADLAVKSQMTEFAAVYTNTYNAFRTESDANYGGQYEIDASYERYLTDYFRPYIGITLLRQSYYNVLSDKEIFSQEYDLPVVGIRYTLPYFIESDLRITSKGRVRLELNWQLWLLPRLFTLYRVNTDREYHLDAQYILSRDFALSAGYDSRYKWGGGILWRF